MNFFSLVACSGGVPESNFWFVSSSVGGRRARGRRLYHRSPATILHVFARHWRHPSPPPDTQPVYLRFMRGSSVSRDENGSRNRCERKRGANEQPISFCDIIFEKWFFFHRKFIVRFINRESFHGFIEREPGGFHALDLLHLATIAF